MPKKNNLSNLELVHIHTEGPAPQVTDEYRKHFRDNSFFLLLVIYVKQLMLVMLILLLFF